MTAAGVVTITSSVPAYRRSLRGRTLAVREFFPHPCGGMCAMVVLPPGWPPVTYPLADWEWVRVA